MTSDQIAKGREIYDAMFAAVNAPDVVYEPLARRWRQWLFDNRGGLLVALEQTTRTHDNKGAPLGDEQRKYPGAALSDAFLDSMCNAAGKLPKIEADQAAAWGAVLPDRPMEFMEIKDQAPAIPYLTIYEWDVERSFLRVLQITRASGAKRVYVNPKDAERLEVGAEVASSGYVGKAVGVTWFSDVRIPVGSFGVAP